MIPRGTHAGTTPLRADSDVIANDRRELEALRDAEDRGAVDGADYAWPDSIRERWAAMAR